MGEVRNAHKISVGKREGKRPFGYPRHGWEDNIKKAVMKMGVEGVDSILLAQDRGRWLAFVARL
jgi:hypothetical protein